MSGNEQAYQQCLDAAARYLGFRPRSESELRERLKRRGFDQDSIEKSLLRLKEQGVVDDVAFARFWKENRESFRPRSRYLLEQELRQKGVDPEIAQNIAQEVDEESSAYRVAQQRMKTLASLDYPEFYRHLGAFLWRRGFHYDRVKITVERLWQEKKNAEESLSSQSKKPSP